MQPHKLIALLILSLGFTVASSAQAETTVCWVVGSNAKPTILSNPAKKSFQLQVQAKKVLKSTGTIQCHNSNGEVFYSVLSRVKDHYGEKRTEFAVGFSKKSVEEARAKAKQSGGGSGWQVVQEGTPKGAILSAQTAPKLIEISITRNMTCQDDSTIGTLTVNGDTVGRTLELPWRNNESDISRIPPGRYDATIRQDGSRGWRIQLEGVKDRRFVQIHIGNYPSQIQGCILVGKKVAKDSRTGECMVTSSGATLATLSKTISKHAAGQLRTEKEIQIVVTVQ